ncbi:MAG: YifB family Mg chelatase-like AAA ATPase [Acidobacteriota bacterium]
MSNAVVRAHGAALFGVDAVAVEVEVAETGGIPRSGVLGQADAEVREARDRLRVALQRSGFWPWNGEAPLVVNLAPAGWRKTGTGLDLPMALAIVALKHHELVPALGEVTSFGELGLDGRLRAARGTLSVAMMARDMGMRRLLVPPEAAREAAEVEGLEVLAARTIADAVRALCGDRQALAVWPSAQPALHVDDCDLAEVRGQRSARRALEVAAAGAHNLLFIGPPGSGKTLLARRLPTILPELTHDEALEVTRVHSAAGLIPSGQGLVRSRPFRSPHHSVSAAGLVGGGSHPRPGELSLAVNGVLFLDELPEFSHAVLETLRQPLEDGEIHVTRVLGRARFPARLMLVAAMNPCPCGWYGSGAKDCLCTKNVVDRYLARISGPLLDRVDLHVPVPALAATEVSNAAQGESSMSVRARVSAARERQRERNAAHGVLWNAQIRARDLPLLCPLSPAAQRALEAAMTRLKLSARAHDRVIKVARSIADLVGKELIDVAEIAEAVTYRGLDRTE